MTIEQHIEAYLEASKLTATNFRADATAEELAAGSAIMDKIFDAAEADGIFWRDLVNAAGHSA